MSCKSTILKNEKCFLPYSATETASFYPRSHQTSCFFCTDGPSSLPLSWPALTDVTTFDGLIQIEKKQICCLSMQQSTLIFSMAFQRALTTSTHKLCWLFFFLFVKIAVLRSRRPLPMWKCGTEHLHSPSVRRSRAQTWLATVEIAFPWDGNCQTPSISS